MASCSTAQWSGDYTPQVKLTVTQKSSTDTQVVLAWTLEYVTHGGYTANTNGIGRDYSVKIDGDTVKTGTFDINGKTTTTITSGTKTVDKTTSARDVAFSCSFYFDITWSDIYGGTKTASNTISIGAKTSYTVKYNANGGSSTPSSQTKWHGTALTLSGAISRTGYKFKCWNTKSDGSGTSYNAGASYTTNSTATLYAIWTEYKLTVNYYSNNATGAFDGALNAVGSGKNVKVYASDYYYDNDYSTYGLGNYSNSSGSIYMTRTGYTATGKWGTSTSGGTLIDEDTGYSTGQALAKALGKDLSSGDATINVYAQWSENYLRVNYYSNYATSYNGTNTAKNTVNNNNVLIWSQDYYYDNAYTNGLNDYTSGSTLGMIRTGYTSTNNWGTTTSGGTLVAQNKSFATGQALAQALGKDVSNANASVNVYAQWKINTYTIAYNSNGGTGSISSQSVNWGEDFTISVNTFEKEGYKCIGYNVKRSSDNKWYVTGQKWQSESDIESNGYTKKLYAEGEDNHTMGTSWTDGTATTDTFTFYAVWKLSGVVYVSNGTSWDVYIPYINNGTSWDMYIPYVCNGEDWDVIS